MSKIYLTTLVILLLLSNICSGSLINRTYHVNNAYIYTESYGKGPVVVFESGMGDGIASWKKVAPSVSKYAHVILYDRPGIGFSKFTDKNLKPHTAKAVTKNLLDLLRKMNVSPPYILVGHSLGGLYVQYFAKIYPKLVKGIVLVDSVNAQQPKNDPLPADDIGYYREALGLSESEKQTLKAGKFPNVPLIVLSATLHGGPNSQYNTKANKLEWATLQAQLANMSTKSEHVTANNTEHDIQKERPWLVIAAIKQIMTD